MAGFAKSMGALTSLLGMSRDPKLPPLPDGLGLPDKANTKNIGQLRGGEINTNPGSTYQKEFVKAENYNKAFADLLNKQPHLSKAERSEIYNVYSDKFTGVRGGNTQGIKKLTDYGSTLTDPSPATDAQQAPVSAPETAVPAPVAEPVAAPATQAPQTVGTVTKPVEQAPAPAPAPTPVVATPGGNIAGKTTTTGGTESSGPGSTRKQRGRFATLLTGLGGSLERFG